MKYFGNEIEFLSSIRTETDDVTLLRPRHTIHVSWILEVGGIQFKSNTFIVRIINLKVIFSYSMCFEYRHYK